MSKRIFTLAHATARRGAIDVILSAPEGYIVEVRAPTRNLDQNALLWALLSDIAEQVIWHGRWLKQDAWKDIFTAALKKQEVVPNIDGDGFVVLGQRTSKMSKREFSDLCELIKAFGAERGVKWSG